MHASIHAPRQVSSAHRGAGAKARTSAALREGRVTELGDHAALMAAGGDYARMFRAQTDGHQGEDAVGGR